MATLPFLVPAVEDYKEFSEKPKTESLSSYHSEDFFGRNDDYEEPLPLT